MAKSPRLGLALSGGGFRASLFHLGVVRYLREQERLQDVSHIAAASAGSIVAAHLVQNWERYTTGSRDDYLDLENELLSFIHRGVHRGIFWKMGWAWLGRLPRNVGSSDEPDHGVRTGMLNRELERLYGSTKMSTLRHAQRDAPQIYLTATNLEDAKLTAFTENGILLAAEKADETPIPAGDTTVALAVTASCAFPHFFPPIEIAGHEIAADDANWRRPDVKNFTDGGVMDNTATAVLQGIFSAAAAKWQLEQEQKQKEEEEEKEKQRVLKQALPQGRRHAPRPPPGDPPPGQPEKGRAPQMKKGVRTGIVPQEVLDHSTHKPWGGKPTIIVSDAGAALDYKSNVAFGTVRTAMRAADILSHRVTNLQKKRAKIAAKKGDSHFIWAEIDESDAAEHEARKEVQQELRNIRTDLDRFTIPEIRALVGHGYGISRTFLKKIGTDVPTGDHGRSLSPRHCPPRVVRSHLGIPESDEDLAKSTTDLSVKALQDKTAPSIPLDVLDDLKSIKKSHKRSVWTGALGDWFFRLNVLVWIGAAVGLFFLVKSFLPDPPPSPPPLDHVTFDVVLDYNNYAGDWKEKLSPSDRWVVDRFSNLFSPDATTPIEAVKDASYAQAILDVVWGIGDDALAMLVNRESRSLSEQGRDSLLDHDPKLFRAWLTKELDDDPKTIQEVDFTSESFPEDHLEAYKELERLINIHNEEEKGLAALILKKEGRTVQPALINAKRYDVLLRLIAEIVDRQPHRSTIEDAGKWYFVYSHKALITEYLRALVAQRGKSPQGKIELWRDPSAGPSRCTGFAKIGEGRSAIFVELTGTMKEKEYVNVGGDQFQFGRPRHFLLDLNLKNEPFDGTLTLLVNSTSIDPLTKRLQSQTIDVEIGKVKKRQSGGGIAPGTEPAGPPAQR